MIMPNNKEYLPQAPSFTNWLAPKMTKNKPKDAMAGCLDGAGT
jgi:hypothetical protein